MSRVSIITPFYNSDWESYVRSRTSIEYQTAKDFEWILIDDGSTDRHHAIPYEVRIEQNYGPSVARNIGFQISSGDIITYLDMGDTLYPDRVDNLLHLYDKYDIDMSFCGYDIHIGNKIQRFNPFQWIGDTMSAFDYIQILQKRNISVPMGVSHRRRPFVEAGGFQRGIVCGEDGVLWRRMLTKIEPTKVVITDDFAGEYFVSETGQSRTQRRFEMGGFAIDGSLEDNGQYLDDSWFKTFSSEEYYE